MKNQEALMCFCVLFVCFLYLEKGKKCVEKPGKEKNLAKNGMDLENPTVESKVMALGS